MIDDLFYIRKRDFLFKRNYSITMLEVSRGIEGQLVEDVPATMPAGEKSLLTILARAISGWLPFQVTTPCARCQEQFSGHEVHLILLLRSELAVRIRVTSHRSTSRGGSKRKSLCGHSRGVCLGTI